MSVSVTSSVANPYRHTIKAGNFTFYSDSDVPASKTTALVPKTAPTPHELLLGALGACTSMQVQAVARIKGLKLDEVKVDVSDTQTTPPGATKPVRSIDKKVEIKAQNLSDKDKASLEKNANRCHVNTVLTNSIPVVSTFNWTV